MLYYLLSFKKNKYFNLKLYIYGIYVSGTNWDFKINIINTYYEPSIKCLIYTNLFNFMKILMK